MRRRALGASFVALALLLGGCSSAPADGAARSSAPSASPGLHGSLTVYAAASLTAAFDRLAKEFGRRHPGVDVRPVSFDGSSTLATQIREGAPADVFASADRTNMRTVVKAGLVDGSPTPFVSNTLEIAVPPGNPKHITGLADLVRPGLLVDLCAPEVPCGAASGKLLDDDSVRVTPASREQNVKAVVTKVALGEADAGLVYRTDVAAADGKVDGVRIPDADKAINVYPIAVLKNGSNPAAGRAFVRWVLSDAGQKVLHGYGFRSP